MNAVDLRVDEPPGPGRTAPIRSDMAERESREEGESVERPVRSDELLGLSSMWIVRWTVEGTVRLQAPREGNRGRADLESSMTIPPHPLPADQLPPDGTNPTFVPRPHHTLAAIFGEPSNWMARVE